MAMITKYTEYLNERMYISTSLDNIIRYLAGTKNDKVALFLLKMYSTEYYKDDEILNYIGLAKQDNMIDYLPTNRRPDEFTARDRALAFNDPKRVTMRIGRAIKRIYDTVKKSLNYETSTKCRIYSDRWNTYSYIIDFDKTSKSPSIDVMILHNNSGNPETTVEITLEIDGEKISFNGHCDEVNSHWDTFTTLVVISDYVTYKRLSNKFENISGMWDQSRFDKEFNIPIDIKITNNFEITDVDIEKFTNEFISFVKMNKADDTSSIKEVNGKDIRFWYDRNNYCGDPQQAIGKLGNSCMSYVECQEYLDIYVDNVDRISMLILTNKDNKLVGRALLWVLDGGETFMDRVYTSNDFDDNIFTNYAISKGYIYRAFSTTATGVVYYKDSQILPDFTASVTLIYSDYEEYPYVDTLKYLIGKTLNNKNPNLSEDIKTLTDTEGGWEERYNEDDD